MENDGRHMIKYHSYSDEELVSRIREDESGITDYLLEKYKNLVRKKAKAMYLIGGDNEDLIQEGMIGLFKAIRDYNPEKRTSFFNFAELCITRQIYTAVTSAGRQKHIPLNSYISIYSKVSDNEKDGVELFEVMEGDAENNPESLVIHQENLEQLEQYIEENLSEFEKEVLDLHLTGHGYQTIAGILEKTPKSVDNALQRIKTKISRFVC